MHPGEKALRAKFFPKLAFGSRSSSPHSQYYPTLPSLTAPNWIRVTMHTLVHPPCGHWVRCFGSISDPLTFREPPGPDLPSQVFLNYCSYNLNNSLFLSRPPTCLSILKVFSISPLVLPPVSPGLVPFPHWSPKSLLLSPWCPQILIFPLTGCYPSVVKVSPAHPPVLSVTTITPGPLCVVSPSPGPHLAFAFPPPLLANAQALVLTAPM